MKPKRTNAIKNQLRMKNNIKGKVLAKRKRFFYFYVTSVDLNISTKRER